MTMDLFGFTSPDFWGLLILAVILFAIWLVLKYVLKMTVGVLKIGCLGAVLIMVAAFILFRIF